MDFLKEQNGSNIEKIYDLHTQLLTNVIDIEAITENIQKITLITPDDFDSLEDLYYKEFLLYMNNVHIAEDLATYVSNEPKTIYNELELKRIEKDIIKLLRVDVFAL